MIYLEMITERLAAIMELGGPVVMLLLGLSVVSLAVVLWKFWQLAYLGVGRHRQIAHALDLWDLGDRAGARAALQMSRSRLAPVLSRAASGSGSHGRAVAEAGAVLDRMERGFRILDSIAQIAPLLGLFGTVLGMIGAFQAMQEAGANVDPSTLAGGIWVALLTTAAGLAVAMPTSLMLTFFESRVARARGVAETAIETIFAPSQPTTQAAPAPGETLHSDAA
ncbi:MotA/TolQ/ExbB proton channel family protein [Poseidonocella sedimentorum]|uniref:Outer membrane transport energization protein ExbB n=1 Tax=Poseidonocella sedimentorum TaxID=871652 RepID=A0A1I6E4S3_9RHOB|nr:MotA/TolQ/ExbB proton channel family protein [Poseidonocella sedimentorum]SFR12696.1 outer membrane transport energization protein ExbB [Poseidonocella sedimentorum]